MFYIVCYFKSSNGGEIMTYYSVYRARDALREKEEEYEQLKRDIEDLRTKLSNDTETFTTKRV